MIANVQAQRCRPFSCWEPVRTNGRSMHRSIVYSCRNCSPSLYHPSVCRSSRDSIQQPSDCKPPLLAGRILPTSCLLLTAVTTWHCWACLLHLYQKFLLSEHCYWFPPFRKRLLVYFHMHLQRMLGEVLWGPSLPPAHILCSAALPSGCWASVPSVIHEPSAWATAVSDVCQIGPHLSPLFNFLLCLLLHNLDNTDAEGTTAPTSQSDVSSIASLICYLRSEHLAHQCWNNKQKPILVGVESLLN